jgi:hypothetical protein
MTWQNLLFIFIALQLDDYSGRVVVIPEPGNSVLDVLT